MSADYFEIRAIVRGIINCDRETKKKIGRRFAAHLGLEPWPLGSNDGIDGMVIYKGRKIHFQSRLIKKKLGQEEARAYYSNIEHHGADISVMLSGLGYTETFQQDLFNNPNISEYKIHLLTIRDLFEENPTFQKALQDLPPLCDLSRVVNF